MSEGTFGAGNVATGASLLSQANADSQPDSTTDNNPPVADTQTVPVPTQGNDAPYKQQLEQIPEGFRPLVEPVFQDWDRQVGKKLQEVHSRYEPYKQFLDAEVSPEQLRDSMDLYRMMLENPQRIYEALGQQLGLAQQAGGEQGQGADEEIDLGESPQIDIANDPHFQQLQRQQEIIVQQMQAAQQQREAQEGEVWLDERVKDITTSLEKKGITDPDWDYILTVAGSLIEHKKMDHDKALDAATEMFVSKIQGYMARPTANSTAPTVLPTHGGTPSNQLPLDMSEKDRRSYGAAALRAAQRT